MAVWLLYRELARSLRTYRLVYFVLKVNDMKEAAKERAQPQRIAFWDVIYSVDPISDFDNPNDMKYCRQQMKKFSSNQ